MRRETLIRGCSLAAALAMVAALFVGGSQPAAAGMFAAPWDKLAHVGYFLALTLLLMHGLRGPWWLAPLLAVLVGAGDEWHQLSLPGRQAGWIDVLADAVGAGLGLVVHWLSARRRGKMAA
jgi:VanZ family protein